MNTYPILENYKDKDSYMPDESVVIYFDVKIEKLVVYFHS